MTTTSADNGASAADGGGNGEWSWFSPARKPDAPRGPQGERDGGEEIPSRPVTPIRRVGSGAERRAHPGGTGTHAPAEAPAPGAEAARAAAPGAERPQPPARAGTDAAPGPAEHQRAEDPATGPASAARPATPDRESSPDAVLIRRNLEEIEPVADSVTAYFYALLFVQHPQLRELFPASMDSQRDRLFRAVLTAGKLVDEPEILTEYLSHLGRGHRKYGTRPEHYPAVGECLLASLARYASTTWSDAAEEAWVRAYTTISQTMIDAAAEDEKHSPAWWDAEVVWHERRTSDIAVVTVRPDQPYPFRAGQHTMVETPWWPRVWRHYSFADAPRPDGLLSFHVKAVPAGWVSSALVHRARPGDVVRLGPPAGSMTVDHGSDAGLLCVGGGTGIAPIRALVEDVAEHGRSRPVEVFYGARRARELYDLETMRELERRHPWLSVRAVVSEDDSRPGDRPDGEPPLVGELPEVVSRYGPWASYDGYLSGPPGMIRSGVAAMQSVGVPAHRIRHDSLDELVARGE
ncbi:globin domain-containing protein [Streptomyces sp. JJ36]|uniref:globin domain-containing protein n=1 Tax=Streptomyces sp. JJ36 TaxID=2736645 RepID=UPI001F1B7537|nr:globin domain-containing protein [Streptomyces sp. JJ36]MCF6522167.1 flavohemoprotein [Streptomyces sp. JJ36]